MVTFHSNCTLPPEGVAFVAAPYVRGTADIMWGCGSILLICTWSILHINMPVQTTLSPGNRKQEILRTMLRLAVKIKWMLFNVLAPEWSLGKAWSDYRSVKIIEKRFEEQSRVDQVPWSKTHIHFANMGGFTIKFDDVSKEQHSLHRAVSAPPMLTHGLQSSTGIVDSAAIAQSSSTSREENPSEEPSDGGEKPNQEYIDQGLPDAVRNGLKRQSRRPEFSTETLNQYVEVVSPLIGKIDWRLDEINSALIAQALRNIEHQPFQTPWHQQRFLETYQHWFRNLSALKGTYWILDAHQLLLARQLGIITRLPCVAEDNLTDRNKADLFVKLVALGQITWFVLQLLTRLATHLPTTQLEIMTFAFALCSLFTYILLLDKPKDASYSTIIPAARHPQNPEELFQIALIGPCCAGPLRTTPFSIPNNAIHLNVPVDSSSHRKIAKGFRHLALGMAFAVLVFGAAHAIAWDFVFATETERVLWQASSIITAATLPVWFSLTTAWIAVWRVLGRWRHKGAARSFSRGEMLAGTFLGLGASGVFAAARLFILVEVFRSLALLPPEAYLTGWPANFPHIG